MKRKIISAILSFAMIMTLNISAAAFNEDGIEPYAYSSRETYQTFICVLGGGGTIGPTAEEVYVKLIGNYDVDIAEDTITKVSKDSPVVIVTGFSDITSGDVTYYTANIKRESSFTSTRATFTVTFNIYYTAGPYDTYVDCGSFKITIVGDVNGGEAISWSPYYSSGRYVYAQ